MNSKLFLAIIILLIIILCFLVYRSCFVYVPDVYVCRHMAHDQEIWLEERGFDVKFCRGDSKIGGGGHAWCAINISGVLTHFDSVGIYPFIPFLMYDNVEVYESYDDYLNR